MSLIRNLLITLTATVCVSQAWAQEVKQCTPSKIENVDDRDAVPKAGVVTCIGQNCYYIPKKMDPSVLIRELRKGVTGSLLNLLGPKEGYIGEGRDSNEVSFWHRCQEKLDEMKILAKQYDDPVLSTARSGIQVWVKIYHITTSTFNNFAFGISGIFDGELSAKPPRAQLGGNSNGFDLSMAFGNLTNRLLNINLLGAKESKNAHELRDVAFEVLEGESFNRSLLQKNYRDANFSNPAIEETGYSINGKAFVDDSSGEPHVVIKGFSLTYSAPVPNKENAIANVLSVSRMEISVPIGRPYLLNAENLKMGEGGNKKGLLYLEDSGIKAESKLVVFISAWPTDNPPPADVNLVPLTVDEVGRLPNNPNVDLLQTAKFGVKTTGGAADFDLVQFKLDASGLSANNYNSIVRIKVSGDGLKEQSFVAEAQHLVNMPFQLPSRFGFANEDRAKFKINLEWERPQSLPQGFKKNQKYELVHYQSLRRVESAKK